MAGNPCDNDVIIAGIEQDQSRAPLCARGICKRECYEDNLTRGVAVHITQGLS